MININLSNSFANSKIINYKNEPITFDDKNMNNINKLKKKLKMTIKSQEAMYEELNAEKILSFYNPLKNLKYILFKKYDIKNVTNAWLKCYELLYFYNFKYPKKNVIMFDNGAFPGCFILATKYYFNTIKNKNLIWYANSLIESKKSLKDKFGLYKNYKNNWMMDKNNDGNIINTKNIIDFKRKIKEKSKYGIDLYMSDVGFRFDDFLNEENEYYFANIGQILTGLVLLNKGGNMIFKQFSYFNLNSISILYLLTYLFKNVYINKPLASKIYNSENYVVCINYKGCSIKILSYLFNYLEKKNVNPVVRCINPKFLYNVKNSLEILYNRQIIHINKRMKWFYYIQSFKIKKNGHLFQFIAINRKKVNKHAENEWLKNNKLIYYY